MKRVVVFAILLITIPTFVLGQAQTTGRLLGRVVDQDGKPVADARVTLISSSLQGERVTQTDSDGVFLASLLPIGPYAVSVASPGMETVQISLRLTLGQTAPLEIVLKPGKALVETERVVPATPLTTTVSGENFNYVKEVEELPIADRDIENVTTFAPNVQYAAGDRTVAIAGSTGFDTNFLLDGGEILEPREAGAEVVYIEDAIEEVQVMTSGISARYGRFAGGVVNAITKSGGNSFDGTLRVELTNQKWNSTTPFGEEQADDTRSVYQGTLGGYVLKDRLWFFLGGRTMPEASTSRTTSATLEPFEVTVNEDRWQAKLRGAITANHTVEVSLLDYDRDQTGSDGRFLSTGDLGASRGFIWNDTRQLLTLDYRGILSSKTYLNAVVTKKDFTIERGGDASLGSAFEDFGTGIIYHSGLANPADEIVRDNRSAAVGVTHVFSSASGGSHTLDGGVQYLETISEGTRAQSPTGLELLGLPLGATPFAVPNTTTGEVRYNLNNVLTGGDVLVGRRDDLPAPGEHKVKNTALYVQDAWQLGKWRFDLGLRLENYRISSPRSDLDLDLDAVAPRLGVTRDIGRRWQIQATAARYYGRFLETVMNALTGISGAPNLIRLYTGPPLMDQSADEAEAILQDLSQWGALFDIADRAGQPVDFLASDVDLPYADELTLGFRGALPRDTGFFTATYIDRQYEDFFTAFRGDLGAQDLVDPVTGAPLGRPVDNTIWDNSDKAERQYKALALTADYRPSARWSIGGNWTLSETTGNYEGEEQCCAFVPGPIGWYERSRPEDAAVPDGNLDEDQRHRLNIWGNYRFDLSRAGALVLGAVGRYQSGRNWSRTASVSLADDPDYNIPPNSVYNHFFDGRGNNTFDAFWTLDASARYQLALWPRKLDGWLKLTVLNVFNNDALIGYQTTGFADTDPSGELTWVPTGDCGPGDAPSVSCSGFGRIRNEDDYQLPRSYMVTLGLAF